MKNIVKKAVILTTLMFVLTSCITLGDFLTSSGTSDVAPTSVNMPDTEIATSYVHEETDASNFYERSVNPYKNTALSDTWNVKVLESTGAQNLLVIPVSFTDSAPEYLNNEAAVKASLNRAFFGQSSDTGWESVASYYAKASYGAFSLSGEVSNIFHSSYSMAELDAKPINDNDYWDQTHYILEDIYNSSSASKLQQFDQNNDGYVDAVFLVYLAPFGGSDLFWAYQYFWNRFPNAAKPTFSVYAWASFNFMVEDSNYTTSLPAAHTFIHEFGHIMGLDDYYDYDNKSSPIGGKDMMDFNIGDHNMHSKYVLNWGLPFVPVGDATINIRPAESSGDFILINNDWNGHAYDEYILIEYYTPTGLNKKDAEGSGYSSGLNRAKNFTENGVRIFHVDARLIYSTTFRTYWTDEIRSNQPGRDTTDYAMSNTGSDSLDARHKRIHLLDASKGSRTWYHSATRQSDNSALFKSGQKINLNGWGDYLFTGNGFNDRTTIGYSVEIGTMNEYGVEIILRTT